MEIGRRTINTGSQRGRAFLTTAPLAPIFEFALGMACLAFAGTIVFALRLGGVVATLTADRGIHSGDFAAVPLVLAGVALLAVAVRPNSAR